MFLGCKSASNRTELFILRPWARGPRSAGPFLILLRSKGVMGEVIVSPHHFYKNYTWDTLFDD